MRLFRPVRYVLLATSFVWLLASGGPYGWAEAQFMLTVLAVTSLTRTLSFSRLLTGYAFGVGVAAPAVVLAGRALSGSDWAPDTAAGNVLAIPLLEETVKIGLVALVAWIAWRTGRLVPNASDLVAIGALVGGGFAMVEVSYWDRVVMGPPYGPRIAGVPLFPTAMDGYAGHAVATAFVAAVAGVGLRLRAIKLLQRWWALPAFAAFAWITVEHALANLRHTGEIGSEELYRILGQGKMTPRLVLIAVALLLALDVWHAVRALRGSGHLRAHVGLHVALVRWRWRRKRKVDWRSAALLLRELRLVNAVGWRLAAGRVRAPSREETPHAPVPV